MWRSAILAVRSVFLLAGLLLGACEDHTADIQAVQGTPMREVADNGARKMAHQRMTGLLATAYDALRARVQAQAEAKAADKAKKKAIIDMKKAAEAEEFRQRTQSAD